MKRIITFCLLFFTLGTGLSFSQMVSTLTVDTTKSFEAMHWHEDGRIYCVDYANGRLYQIHLDGSVDIILQGFSALAGGGFDADGNFYVASINAGEILRVNGPNDYTVVAGGFSQPVGVLQDQVNPDIFYVSEWQTSKVTKFIMSTGELIPFVQGDGIFGPDGMLWDWNGDLMVSNFNNHKIHTIDAEGNVAAFWDLDDNGDLGYIAIVDDFVYVPSLGNNHVLRINQQGQATTIAGSGDVGNDDGTWSNAEFNDPNGLCASPSGDTLLIGDGPRIRLITGFSPSLDVVEIEQSMDFSITPNPVTSDLRMTLSAREQDEVEWQIIDDSGRVNKEGTWQVSKQYLFQGSVSIVDLAQGKYHLRLRGSKNEPWISKAFVKM